MYKSLSSVFNIFLYLLALDIFIASRAQNNTKGYACLVPNCQMCSFPNFCGLCENNYILQVNLTDSVTYCQSVTCTLPNCLTCYQDNICSQCANGYYISAEGMCQLGTANNTCVFQCSSCNGTYCLLCNFGYVQSNGNCFPVQPNRSPICQSAFTLLFCQLCIEGYIVDPTFSCIPNPQFTCNQISNCLICENGIDNTTGLICQLCGLEYELSANNTCQAKICNISECMQCKNQQLCEKCLPQFQVSNGKCILQTFYCNITNCLYCYQPDLCAACTEGFYVQILTQNNTNLSSVCTPYINPQITNCITLGPMIPGTTSLEVGCVICQEGFINVGGYCMANLTQSSYICNISNCLYCVQNNICGKCAQGYNAYLGSKNMCIKSYSPISNCETVSLFQVGCVTCSKGYVLIANSYCILIVDNPVVCNISGCSYCLENNICTTCRQGYSKIVDSCLPLCSVQNCYKCDTNGDCVICNLNYFLTTQGNITFCQSIQNQSEFFCFFKFGSACTACNFYNCTQCGPAFTLNSGLCCLTPQPMNMSNCTQYSITFSSNCSSTVTCTSCQIGSVIIITQTPYGEVPVCLWLKCNITNCAYCYRSSLCEICQSGYFLKNNQCQPYISNCNVTNCVQCADNSDQCAVCLDGYLLYKGNCVCGFQNCLTCLGSVTCTKCATPTVASLTSNTGCLPQNVQLTLCTVPNCLSCMSPNFCSSCVLGFSLLPNGTCLQNVCNRINFCAFCDADQLFCYNCLSGYLQTSNLSPGCTPIPSNYSCQVLYCSFCEINNPSNCSVCAVFYQKNSTGKCVAINCIQNCVFCLVLDTCVICQSGYYLTNNNTCVTITSKAISCPIIPNCVGCQLSPGSFITICIQCIIGMQPSSNGLSCIPQTCNIPNCVVCDYLQNYSSQGLCFICGQGYFLNSYFQCSPANSLSVIPGCSSLYNCIFCAYEGYCVLCFLGWMPINGICVTNESTLCLVSNCQACTQGNICIKCNTNYQLISNNQCLLNCLIPNCVICITENLCESCMNNMVVIEGNTCGCPDSTFIIIDSQCQCPIGFQPNPAGLTCIQCNINYCISCSAPNICQSCQNNLTLIQSTSCNCPDSTFTITDGFCVCPSNTTLAPSGNTCIICQIANCQTCSIANFCISCISNLTLINPQLCGCPTGESLVDSYCVYCQVEFCSSCSSTNYCSQCNNSLLVANNGICSCHAIQTFFNNTCIQCNINNCILCKSANTCTTCATGYYGPSQNLCTLCQVPSCTVCPTPNYCTSCLLNLKVNSQGNQCVNCSIKNCSLCSINNTCAVCDVGYQLVNVRLCVLCTVQGCAVCMEDNLCQVCQAGYVLSIQFTCNLCVAPCASCSGNSSTLCSTCLSPFSSSPQNNQCYTCQIQNCAQCSQNSPTVCTQCSPNYAINIFGFCIYAGPCSINCISCLLNQACLQCADGYAVNTTQRTQCVVCNVSNCQTCSSSDVTTCFVCLTGYFEFNGICSPCPYPNCQTCNATTCLTYQPSTNQILILTSTTQYAALCDPGCTTCSLINPISCIVCDTGYVLNQNRTCIPCTYPCLECLSTNVSQCVSCFTNFYLSGNACLACVASFNCLTCLNTDLSQCTTCPYGYLLNSISNNCQVPCPNFCLTCSSPNFCTKCIQGYSTNQTGNCLPCVSNCRTCAQNFQSVCLGCGVGFYLSNNSCVVCSQFCSECNSMGCLSCFVGYFLNSQLACVVNCISPCATCLENSPNSCLSCLFGYTTTQNGSTVTCTPHTNCSSGACQFCPVGYIYSNTSYAQCAQCVEDSRCARCNSSNLTQCYSCLNGFYLNIKTQTCTICPVACSSCTDPDNCLTCASGYTIQTQLVSGIPGKCIQCQSPCLECMGNGYTCSACVDGYILNGWNCQTLFNFGFVMTLQATSSVFYQNYGNLLARFASAVNSTSLQTVTVILLQLQPGIVTEQVVSIIGNISSSQPPDTLTAYIYYTSLSTLFITNSTYNGMQILTYSLQLNNGEVSPPQPQNDSKNLPIILGVCIPVLVIIIVAIVYYCYKKKKRQSEDSALDEIFYRIAQKSAKENATSRQSQMTYITQKNQQPPPIPPNESTPVNMADQI